MTETTGPGYARRPPCRCTLVPVGDEPQADSRETCYLWESRVGKCHLKSLMCQFESLFRGCEPCADCPG